MGKVFCQCRSRTDKRRFWGISFHYLAPKFILRSRDEKFPKCSVPVEFRRWLHFVWNFCAQSALDSFSSEYFCFAFRLSIYQVTCFSTK